MVKCLERDAELHVAQLMPLPLTVSCFSEIQIGFTFLGLEPVSMMIEKGRLRWFVHMACYWLTWLLSYLVDEHQLLFS